MTNSAGKKFRQAIVEEKPLQIAGAATAFSALLAQQAGFKAIYLSGAGVANSSFGLPDLGMTSMNDVAEDVRRVCGASDLPLLVDIDTGWGGAFNIGRSIQEMINAGAAAVHLEDQVAQKRCGHRPNKAIVSITEMNDRIKAAVDAKTDPDFVIMARTDALAVDGYDAVLERVGSFVEAGADAIFAEAMTDIELYKKIIEVAKVPVLANLTEFGQTPLYDLAELRAVGLDMVLYPLSAFRAMSKAALSVYTELRTQGTQTGVLDDMQTRMELYDVLDYHSYEQKLDELFSQSQENN